MDNSQPMGFYKSGIYALIILLAISLLNTGCELINTPPGIDKISAQPDRINTYDKSTLICEASDADDDKLSYSWSSTNGAFIGGSNRDSVTWQAPNIPGRYTINVKVSDDYDFIKESTIIVVAEAFNYITIPSGSFSYGEGSEPTLISYSFEIMKYEVTNAQYAKYLEEAISVGEITISSDVVSGYYTGDENNTAGSYTLINMQTDECKINYFNGAFIVDDGYDNHPVVMVTWFGAYLFAAHYGFDLPNEYEWEKAARGPDIYVNTDFPWGTDDLTCDHANHFGCVDGTQIVGISMGKSYYGIYDMAGNVWEWTNSFYDTTVTNRVRRGGAFNNDAGHLYTWYRYHTEPIGTYPAIGFRCIRKN